MIKTFKEEATIYKLATIAILIGMAFLLYRICLNMILGIDYPNELLEPSNVSLTRLFLEGKSPYSLQSLSYERPAISYEYPFINSMLAAAISFVFRINPVLSHYIVSLLSIVGTLVLGIILVEKYSKTTVAPAAVAFLYIMCHWRFGFVSAAPDDLGLFVITLTFLLATSEKITHKPLICAIMTTICFYTKQYFVLAALVIFVYMLFYSKKEAFRFAIFTVAINLVVGVIITLVWPLYWTYTFYFIYFGTLTSIETGIASLISQMKYLMAIFFGMFIVMIVALMVALRRRKAGLEKKEWFKIKENDIYSLSIIQIPVMIIPLIVLGKNDGAFLSYFLQLWMPAIIIVTVVTLERMKEEVSKLIFDIFYLGIIAVTILYAYLKLPLHILTDEEIANWNKAYAIVESYRNEGDVHYAQELAYLAFEDGSIYCMCGHDGEVTSEETYAKWEQSEICRRLFPYAGDIITKNIEFKKEMIDMFFRRDFGLISFEDGNSLLFGRNFIDQFGNYTELDEVTLQLGNMPYEVTFYERTKDWKGYEY